VPDRLDGLGIGRFLLVELVLVIYAVFINILTGISLSVLCSRIKCDELMVFRWVPGIKHV